MNREALAAELRLRYRYRRLILNGELKLPWDAAVALIGPDCAYHLHGRGGASRDPPSLPGPNLR